MLPAPCERITGITACMATIGPKYIEMKNFIEQHRFNLFDWSGIAAPRVVDKPIDAAVVVVDGSHSLARCFEVRHVGYDWETVGKLTRELLKSLFGAGKQGHLSIAIRKSGRCGQSDSRRRASYDEYAIFDLTETSMCFALTQQFCTERSEAITGSISSGTREQLRGLSLERPLLLRLCSREGHCDL